ncbi:Superfamily II DNA or RNA helicase [Brevibacterium sp. Mu109]|uniref:sacsin N-terminal ATP-binding-like domain-containing protein n=1 Tax=Brevibacterium sp. Mu109 TaxID=1255669 RepID=UPI000C601DA4|nr:DEAD/DEAH box helicase family protein [Brevibacterium sp. Mu109]SMX95948.1 Superfamily II DNA or RNA helicase [Brevibacterium sp. Mu109]
MTTGLPEDRLIDFLEREYESTLESYRARPDNIRENAGQEQAIIQGGYARKQIQELVQNAVDALRGSPGRIHVIRDESTLYVANEGKSFDRSGVRTLLHSNMSDKRDNQIGRFGLGFKSVLEVSDRPQIFTGLGAFGFDAERSRRELEEIQPGLADYPILRLPYPLDVDAEKTDDAILAELLGWASTVIRVPLRERYTWLDDQIVKFPHQFMLFSEAVNAFTAEVRTETTYRETWVSERAQHGDGSIIQLSSGTANESWVVAHTVFTPSERARRDAGSLHSRDSLTVHWAVEHGTSGRARERGEIWNHFPTGTVTTMPGIINASFKMNDDRMTLLHGDYNAEILRDCVPRLVTSVIPHLYTESDPGAHLDRMPARGLEDAPWFRENLIEPVTRAIAFASTVPDLQGDLAPLSELSTRPKSLDEEPDLVGSWTQRAREQGIRTWVHESALDSRFRSALVDRLLEINGQQRKTTTEWIEGLSAEATRQGFEAAIVFADEFMAKASSFAGEIQQARIVPMADGHVARLSGPKYFIDSADDRQDISDKPEIIDPRVASDGDVISALRRFGAALLDSTGRLKQVLDATLADESDHESAETFWRMASKADPDTVIKLIQRIDPGLNIPVRNAAGGWIPLHKAWSTGRLLHVERYEDKQLIIDGSNQFLTAAVCRKLGVPSALPQPEYVSADKADGGWFDTAKDGILKELKRSHGPETSLTLGSNITVPQRPRLWELAEASSKTRHAITMELLASPQRPIRLKGEATYRVDGQFYKQAEEGRYAPPDILWIKKHGVLDTSYGLYPAGACTGRIEGIPDELLPTPTAIDDELFWLLGLPTELSTAQWRNILSNAESELDSSLLPDLYGHAAKAGVRAPVDLRGLHGAMGNYATVPAEACVVTTDAESQEHLLEHSSAVVLTPTTVELAEVLEDKWKLKYLRIHFTTRIDADEVPREGRAERIRDRFPYLAELESKVRKRNQYELLPCSSLRYVTENDFDDVISAVDQAAVFDIESKRLYYRKSLRSSALIKHILEYVGSPLSVREAEERMKETAAQEKLHDFWDELKEKESDEERVRLLLGDDGIRSLVPDSAVELLTAEGEPVTPTTLFSLAQNIHGSDLWRQILGRLPDDEGSAREWAKDARTRDLTELGFSEDMFRAAEPRKPAREEFPGPVSLPKLHAFQRSTSRKILKVLKAKPGSNKAIVQLPTGAGKTRVAVESLITHVSKSNAENNRIVWIAQSEELCEQAVEAWGSGWQGLGIPGERLVVSRLWDGRSVEEESSALHVVVATIQTLTRIASAKDDTTTAVKYAWLKDPDVVVIDEAHGATTRSYTTVLRWFGRSTTQKGKPLLGLSATPYRGTSEVETQRLVSRFGGTLIEPDEFTAESAHTYLQDHQILAHVVQEELEGTTLKHQGALGNGRGRSGGGSSADERQNFLEKRIDLDSVASDLLRNRTIIQHLTANLDHIEHAIVFAASVEHAQALAAVLQTKGIEAAAIYGGTDPARRRSLVRRFRDGEIKVLTNFDVLSQGFDAPKVDAIYLCRPTFSPNKYIQMIGRGLRGPKNGGSEEVLIVNIRDNLDNFGDSLAYTEFAYLWDEQSAEVADA